MVSRNNPRSMSFVRSAGNASGRTRYRKPISEPLIRTNVGEAISVISPRKTSNQSGFGKNASRKWDSNTKIIAVPRAASMKRTRFCTFEPCPCPDVTLVPARTVYRNERESPTVGGPKDYDEFTKRDMPLSINDLSQIGKSPN